MQPPVIFNRNRIQTRLKRRGFADDHFIAELVHGELQSRLATITRKFEKALFVAPSQEYLLDKGHTASDPIQFETATTLLPAKDIQHLNVEQFTPSADQYDLIISLMDLQTINDVPGFLSQIRNHLKPDGLFMGAALGGETLKELRAVWLKADEEVSGGAFLRVAPFIDIRDAGALLQRAGFALPVADLEHHTVRYEHPLALMSELRAFGATNPMIEVPQKATTRKLLGKVIGHYIEDHQNDDGRVPATLEFIWLSAWAPHESQQKPLAPGSAKVSLKDVLEKDK
ncbi:methyltransferase domain-containing protein [uncultured Maritalea sp.]|jgi:SAM-dependent methyltransferase|uniref:methyltransferase domain-containing protein n=1 Tax=uncultured Maritalea sp. TaxID=757249 RepID=UPI00260BBE5F|nr:methyltransferase domain-containing protein [uncultured Maritalea sp.]